MKNYKRINIYRHKQTSKLYYVHSYAIIDQSTSTSGREMILYSEYGVIPDKHLCIAKDEFIKNFEETKYGFTKD